MGILEVLLVCLGISFDVIAVAVCYGAVLMKIERAVLLRLVGTFCLWQVGAAALGGLVSFIPLFSNKKTDVMYNVCSIIILVGLGLFLLYKGRKHEDLLERRAEINFKSVKLTALLTSFDSLFAGLGTAMWNVNLLIVLGCLLVITALAVVVGVYGGYHLGFEPRKNAYRIGGGVLLVAAVDVLIRVLTASCCAVA